MIGAAMNPNVVSGSWLGSMDSNHGMGASKAPALPLGDSPTAMNELY